MPKAVEATFCSKTGSFRRTRDLLQPTHFLAKRLSEARLENIS